MTTGVDSLLPFDCTLSATTLAFFACPPGGFLISTSGYSGSVLGKSGTLGMISASVVVDSSCGPSASSAALRKAGKVTSDDSRKDRGRGWTHPSLRGRPERRIMVRFLVRFLLSTEHSQSASCPSLFYIKLPQCLSVLPPPA